MKKSWLLFPFLFVALTFADEGMWLFEAPPIDQLAAKYNFRPTQQWLDHVRLSSVRFNNGGSGSFVSADGLTFTNHHVGAKCIQQLSTGGKDYVKTGFYAKTRADEAKCPDLELNVLQSTADVTARVEAVIKPGMSDSQVAEAQRAEMAAIEKECNAASSLRCDVVTLYSGSMYHLYRYKKYTDVRLVFAPEFQTAFFGGDPDNFEFPRYDLDICFFRVYENDKPAHLNDYLKWSPSSVSDSELIFVSGNPGGTSRQDTVAQFEFIRDIEFPWWLRSVPRRLKMLRDFSSQSPENARIAQENIFGLENTYKAFKGEEEGLEQPALINAKAAAENKLRAFVAANPTLKQTTGGTWDAIAQATKTYREIFLPFMYLERRGGFRGELNILARILVRAAEESQKPNGQRLPEYRESALPSLEQQLFSTAPIYKNLEIALFSESIAEMRDELGADNPVVKRVLNGGSPETVAKTAIEATKLDDVAVRKQLYQGGAAAIAASSDPLIAIMREVHPEMLAVRKRHDNEIEGVERLDGALIAKARFSAEGTQSAPDANFTLRLSYGTVRGFVEDGRGLVPKGTKVPYFTTLGGAYQHASEHENKTPYELAQSWIQHKSDLALGTHFNFVSTADIIGGNSGSPTINRAGEIVGIIFDGNIQSLVLDFVYEDAIARAVSVDAQGIQEALRKIYGATGLADELVEGTSLPNSAAKDRAK